MYILALKVALNLLLICEVRGENAAVLPDFPETTSDKVTCPEETFRSKSFGEFLFPETEADLRGKEVKADCPYGFRNDGYESIFGDALLTTDWKKAVSGAIRTCRLVEKDGTMQGEWMPPAGEAVEINYCKRVGWNVTLQQWNEKLQTVTPITFRQIRAIMGWLKDYALDDFDCAVALINGLASLLTSPRLTGISQDDRDRIFDTIEVFVGELATTLPPGFKLQVGDSGIVLESAVFYGLYHFMAARTNDLSENPTYSRVLNVGAQSYATQLAPLHNTNVIIGISAEAVNKVLDQTKRDPQLKITAYNNDIFKQLSKNTKSSPVTPSQLCGSIGPAATLNNRRNVPEEENLEECVVSPDDNSTTCKNQTEQELWGLLCIKLNGVVQNLTDPVEYIIMNDSKDLEGQKMVCVYWDENEEKWSSEDVNTTHIDGGVKCSSSHLTAFSALIEPLPLPFPGAEYAPINNSIHSYILSILSSIGSVCSIIGLSFTLLTYAIFRSLRRERSNRILINLSTSLLLMHIMAVSGSKDLWDGHCFVPAASLHYLVLTSLAWMMVEAVHMFDLLISVFVKPETRFLMKRVVFAWGFPLIIVSICTILEPQVYLVGRADLCLMSAHENIFLYYGAYIAPICVMLLVNFVIFIRIFRVFYQQTKRTERAATQGNGTVPKHYLIKVSPSQIKGATSILVLLGIGWILGLLAMGPFEVLFRYLYCICNASQGLFIFIFRVALNPQACKQWKKVIVGFHPADLGSLDVSMSTSSFGSGRKLKRKNTTISSNFLSASSSTENSLTASNPMSNTLATTLAAILQAESERVKTVDGNPM